ncbi:uncharacterized protein LOC124269201 [Haliotis rubra]|uniref:uncharacterized protein LOC124269201 n=1 Tax=Haliotis rubra TaxID=36100 RepID=UPI001EE5C60F|nr:uncharacterized protein LOC124269201 [Haliotis rubra]
MRCVCTVYKQLLTRYTPDINRKPCPERADTGPLHNRYSMQSSHEPVKEMSVNLGCDDVKIQMEDVEAKAADDTASKADDTTDQTKEPLPSDMTAESRGVHLHIPPDVSLVPKPWGKIKHIIIASYLSLLCCCVPAIFANKYAWEAKRYKDLGLRSEARVLAKNAVCCIYTSVIIGSLLIVIFGSVFLATWIQRMNE